MEQSSQGSFTTQGPEDILAVVISRPKHPGRVRGTGRGMGIRKFFSTLARQVTLSQPSESENNF